jgi:uncharacterized membrane protein
MIVVRNLRTCNQGGAMHTEFSSSHGATRGALRHRRRRSRLPMRALALGAVLMYFMDPDRGRRRRARVRDQWTHFVNMLADGLRVTRRDVRQRAGGLWAQGMRWFRHEDVSDRALVERVRSEIGRYVSHPHALEVSVNEARVRLSGPILAEEVDDLIACVARVRGVREVENRLEAHREAGNLPSLQGGRPRAGHRFEFLQENWSPAARLFTGISGIVLLASGSARRGFTGLGLSVLGAGLVARSASNRDLATLTGVGAGRRGVPVQKTIFIQSDIDRVFEFWRTPENFPRCMRHVREVVPTGENRWRWRVDGPAGSPVEWEAEYTTIVPGQLIAWQTTPGSSVEHSGTVRFDPDPRGGTRLDIQLVYHPPGGVLGHAVARLLGTDPKSELDDDMMRVKTMLETGHPPHDAAQSAHRSGSAPEATLH